MFFLMIVSPLQLPGSERPFRSVPRETRRTTIRRSASHFDCSYDHPNSPQSIRESHYNKHEKGELAAGG